MQDRKEQFKKIMREEGFSNESELELIWSSRPRIVNSHSDLVFERAMRYAAQTIKQERTTRRVSDGS